MNLIVSPGLFRLMLALMVVVSHVSALDIGRPAVLLFFYLSGYWATKIWDQKFGLQGIGRFYAARYLRIIPLYLVVMLTTAWLRGFPVQAPNVILLGLASGDTLDPIGVSWSLDVELQFYLILPLLGWLLTVAKTRWLIVGVLGVAAVGYFIDQSFGILTVAKFMPIFALGAATCRHNWRPSQRMAFLSLGAFVVATGLTALTPFLLKGAGHANPFDADIYNFLWMLPLLPYVAFSLTTKSSKLDRHLGNLSYPLYLVHAPTFALLAGGKVMEIGVALLLAVGLYVLFDRPADRWRVRLTEGPVSARKLA